MFYDEEQLPLYIPKNKNQHLNSSSIKSQNISQYQNQLNGTKIPKTFSKDIDMNDINKENKLIKSIY